MKKEEGDNEEGGAEEHEEEWEDISPAGVGGRSVVVGFLPWVPRGYSMRADRGQCS